MPAIDEPPEAQGLAPALAREAQGFRRSSCESLPRSPKTRAACARIRHVRKLQRSLAEWPPHIPGDGRSTSMARTPRVTKCPDIDFPRHRDLFGDIDPFWSRTGFFSRRGELFLPRREALLRRGAMLSPRREAPSRRGELFSPRREALWRRGELLSSRREQLSPRGEVFSSLISIPKNSWHSTPADMGRRGRK